MSPSTGLWRDEQHRYYWAETPGEVIGPLTSVTTMDKANRPDDPNQSCSTCRHEARYHGVTRWDSEGPLETVCYVDRCKCDTFKREVKA